eukprot:COSAG01_NODE_1416_length_10373_cov_4.944984_5_plen_120_part_00
MINVHRVEYRGSRGSDQHKSMSKLVELVVWRPARAQPCPPGFCAPVEPPAAQTNLRPPQLVSLAAAPPPARSAELLELEQQVVARDDLGAQPLPQPRRRAGFLQPRAAARHLPEQRLET